MNLCNINLLLSELSHCVIRVSPSFSYSFINLTYIKERLVFKTEELTLFYSMWESESAFKNKYIMNKMKSGRYLVHFMYCAFHMEKVPMNSREKNKGNMHHTDSV